MSGPVDTAVAADTATRRDAGTRPGKGARAAPSTGPAPADRTDAQAHEVQVLRDQLSQACRERDDYLDALQRVQAEYDNYRRRARREQSEQHDRGAQALAERILPVLDSFDAAACSPAADGLAPLRRALHDALSAAGLERLEPTGEPFDPAEQHAVEQLARKQDRPAEEDDDQPVALPSVVVDAVLRPGYRWRDRLVRPAMVRVRTE